VSDYISKSALIEEIERQKSLLDKSYDWSYYTTLEIANIFCKIINNQPTISETEIIRKAFERVVERLKELKSNAFDDESVIISDAIEIVKEECGINE
jgi:hypothetical protein